MNVNKSNESGSRWQGRAVLLVVLGVMAAAVVMILGGGPLA